MEDVLAAYRRPYDETNRQLIGETRLPRPVQPGKPALFDYGYARNGVSNLFMMFEPLACWREVLVQKTRTKKDFAHCLRYLAERYYPQAERIVPVMDNLNIHTLASLYAAFPAEQARRLWERFEIHHTPKHGSWLNMAEIEIGVMSRQCLARRIPDMESMKQEVQAWVQGRNGEKGTESDGASLLRMPASNFNTFIRSFSLFEVLTLLHFACAVIVWRHLIPVHPGLIPG